MARPPGPLARGLGLLAVLYAAAVVLPKLWGVGQERLDASLSGLVVLVTVALLLPAVTRPGAIAAGEDFASATGRGLIGLVLPTLLVWSAVSRLDVGAILFGLLLLGGAVAVFVYLEFTSAAGSRRSGDAASEAPQERALGASHGGRRDDESISSTAGAEGSYGFSTEASVGPSAFDREQTRVIGPDGSVTWQGRMRASLAAGGPPFVAHLVFEPAFGDTPEVEAEVTDGEPLAVTVGEVRSFGARLEVRPPRDADAEIEIGWSAVGPA
ncbi:MAG: hypothetical protein AAF532_10515 [Planctomycetota bacterium]